MSGFLDNMAARSRERAEQAARSRSLSRRREAVLAGPRPRSIGSFGSVFDVIAEVKPRSPSEGVFPARPPAESAVAYQRGWGSHDLGVDRALRVRRVDRDVADGGRRRVDPGTGQGLPGGPDPGIRGAGVGGRRGAGDRPNPERRGHDPDSRRRLRQRGLCPSRGLRRGRPGTDTRRSGGAGEPHRRGQLPGPRHTGSRARTPCRPRRPDARRCRERGRKCDARPCGHRAGRRAWIPRRPGRFGADEIR